MCVLTVEASSSLGCEIFSCFLFVSFTASLFRALRWDFGVTSTFPFLDSQKMYNNSRYIITQNIAFFVEPYFIFIKNQEYEGITIEKLRKKCFCSSKDFCFILLSTCCNLHLLSR
jgi:hypothetical protein